MTRMEGRGLEARHRILVVDDTEMFRDLESVFLARTGRVVTAASGAEALASLRAVRPDVAVVDLNMPDLSGDVLCRTLKADAELQTIPVILVTDGDVPEDRARAVRAGANDVIAKPISRVSLIQAVNRLLRPASLRGLARVAMETQVRIALDEGETTGIARNLSRGGLFIETERTAAPATELHLRFALPNTSMPLSPTAQVIWCRKRAGDAPTGMGVQFLALDRDSARCIDDFVYERAALGEALGREAAAQ
jgi:uncharacterized protein (TIGR02266 family)